MARRRKPIGKCSVSGHRRKLLVMRVLPNPYGAKANQIVFVYKTIDGREHLASIAKMRMPDVAVVDAVTAAKRELLEFRPITRSMF